MNYKMRVNNSRAKPNAAEDDSDRGIEGRTGARTARLPNASQNTELAFLCDLRRIISPLTINTQANTFEINAHEKKKKKKKKLSP